MSTRRRLLLPSPRDDGRFLLAGLAGEVRCYEEVDGEREAGSLESTSTVRPSRIWILAVLAIFCRSRLAPSHNWMSV